MWEVNDGEIEGRNGRLNEGDGIVTRCESMRGYAKMLLDVWLSLVTCSNEQGTNEVIGV